MDWVNRQIFSVSSVSMVSSQAPELGEFVRLCHQRGKREKWEAGWLGKVRI